MTVKGQQPSANTSACSATRTAPRTVLPPQPVEPVIERAPSVRPQKHPPNPQALRPIPEERGHAFHHVRSRHAPALPVLGRVGAIQTLSSRYSRHRRSSNSSTPSWKPIAALSSPTTAVDAAVLAAVPFGVAQHS